MEKPDEFRRQSHLFGTPMAFGMYRDHGATRSIAECFLKF
jgi:hypothetical protein